LRPGDDRTDYSRAMLVLESMERALEERASLRRAASEAVGASDALGLERALDAAELNVGQIQALLSELDVYWPPGPDGLRVDDGAPEALLELAERVRARSDAAAREDSAIAERLRKRQDEMRDGLRSIRVTRRTGVKYKAPMAAEEARMFDARR